MELELHDFQATILRELLFNPGSRFRDLNKVDVTNDHFTFHLKRLVKEGLVVKNAEKYSLTQKGKEFANRMDTESLKLEKQGKITVALHALRKKKGQTQYLMHQRLKEPFYGWYGSHSGKIHWGESPLEAAKREFMEETGLTGDFTLKGIVHVLHYHKSDNRLLEDKYFWVYVIENTVGTLSEQVNEGRNIWMTEKQVRGVANSFATFDEMAQVIKSKSLIFIERKWYVDQY